MPELTSPTSGSDAKSPAGDAPGVEYAPNGSGGVDPFEKLFKMSTTAGLGSGEYVAVNGTAIAAVFLGIASAVVLFRYPILLVIPLIGVVCSVLAFQQISKSNGTQTGREAAAIGLLLCLGLGGFVGFQTLQLYLRNTADEKTLSAEIKAFGADIAAGDHTSIASAYEMCDSAFKSRVTLAEFDDRWQLNRHSALFGDMAGMESSGVFHFEEDQVSGDHMADAEIKVNFAHTGNQPFRMHMGFRYVGETWKFDLIELFPIEKLTDKKSAPPDLDKPVVPVNPQQMEYSTQGPALPAAAPPAPPAPTSKPS